MGTPVMGYGSRALLTFGALVLALCVLATASGEGLRWVTPDGERAGTERPEETGAQRSTDAGEEPDTRARFQDDNRANGPQWLPSGRLAALVLLGSLIALGMALVAQLRVSLRRRRLSGDQLRPALSPTAQPDPDDEPDEPLAEALSGAVDDLAHGSPRNSIVAAWLRLEEAAETERFLRNPADTPSEFAERVLTSYALDEAVIGQLAELYREARFSVHPITDQQRDEARACLATLLNDLRTRTREDLR